MTAPPLRTLVGSALALAACDSGDVVAADPCRPGGEVIVVGECLLGLTVGSDSVDVVDRFGPPDRYQVNPEGFGLRFFDYVDHPEGGRVLVALAPRGLFEVGVSGGFTAETEDGIGYGTSQTEVRRLLGRPDAAAGGPDVAGFDRYEFPPDSVSFQFDYALFDGLPGVEAVGLRSSRNAFD